MKSLLLWDKYLANMRAAREQSGFEKADEAAREAVADLHGLEGRIVRTRANTPQGMLVKSRLAALDPQRSQRWTTWSTLWRRDWTRTTSSAFPSS
jgi:hypothetical protein